jgi:hypothetical protein
MAKNYSLEDEHHLVRHIRHTEIDDLGNGQLLAFPQAFQLRSGETYLSNGWLEFFSGSESDCLSGVSTAMSRTRQVKSHHALAIGNVAEIKEACADFGMKVRILHEPFPENIAYATVRQIKTDDDQLLELLAQEAWSDVRMAKPYVEAVGPWRKR